jgi:16S rRNA processing protein RimM
LADEPVENRVAIARLLRPRGNKGELAALALTIHPERYQQLTKVDVGGEEFEVERVWYHKDQPVFKFRGVDTISAAERLTGKDVTVPASERFPLPEGEYYFSDLIGCRVVDLATGDLIGEVTGWQEPGGPALLELDGGRILVPLAKALLPEINVAERVIRASLPEGLVELNGGRDEDSGGPG